MNKRKTEMFLTEFLMKVCKSYVLSGSQFQLKTKLFYSCKKSLPLLWRNLLCAKHKIFYEFQN